MISLILEKLKGKKLGPIACGLGCEIIRDREKKTITMIQRTKVANLLEKFGMQECRPQVTPLVPGETLKALKYHRELLPVSGKEHTRFMSVVGSIQ